MLQVFVGYCHAGLRAVSNDVFPTYSMAVMDHPGKVEWPSLHSASIHISSVTEAAANPRPWQARQEGTNTPSREALNQDYLSPIKLVQLTSEPDLSRVSYLELTINTTENSVGNFGMCTSPAWYSSLALWKIGVWSCIISPQSGEMT